MTDGVTGLLFEPGDPADLARKIARLLDDPELRRRMGLAGRKRFEDDFVWEDVIERYFRPLLAKRRVGVGRGGRSDLTQANGRSRALSPSPRRGEGARRAGEGAAAEHGESDSPHPNPLPAGARAMS